jgi:hypothetical protein
MRELDKQEEFISCNMRLSSLDHPSRDVLERFALSRCSEEELETVETHILACESCVCALETLEVEMAAMKLALEQIAAEQPQISSAAEAKPSWRSWFTFPTLSWATAGLAACALCLFAFLPVSVELKAERGTHGHSVVPEWRQVRLTLLDEGLAPGLLRAEVVNQSGASVWTGTANSANGVATVHLPRMRDAGLYYARLYAAGPEHDLLGEFRFEVKPQF